MAHLTSGELFFFGQVAVDAAKQDSHMRKVTLRQARPARRCGQGNAVKLSAKPSRAGPAVKKGMLPPDRLFRTAKKYIKVKREIERVSLRQDGLSPRKRNQFLTAVLTNRNINIPDRKKQLSLFSSCKRRRHIRRKTALDVDDLQIVLLACI